MKKPSADAATRRAVSLAVGFSMKDMHAGGDQEIEVTGLSEMRVVWKRQFFMSQVVRETKPSLAPHAYTRPAGANATELMGALCGWIVAACANAVWETRS